MNTPLKALFLAFPLAGSMALAAPIAVPYTNDFSTDPAGTFTASTDIKSGASGGISWNSANGTYDSTLNDPSFGNVNAVWSTVSASNLNAGASNFYMSSNFTVTASSSGGGTAAVGLGVSSVTNFPTFSSGNYYTGSFTTFDNIGGTSGRLLLLQSDGATGISLATPTFFSGFTVGTTYLMSLSGEYSGNDLLLTFSITDGVTSQSISATVANQPFATLDNYGYQQTISNSMNQTVAYDNFSLSATPVPEPSSAALLALGLCGFLRGRRAARLR